MRKFVFTATGLKFFGHFTMLREAVFSFLMFLRPHGKKKLGSSWKEFPVMGGVE
jgi:hypothetical protein